MYEIATELDPEFAAAWARLSESYIWAYYSQYSATSEWKAAAKTAVDKAYELDPGLPDAQMALGYYYYYGCNEFKRALQYFESARSVRPNDIEIINGMAFLKRRLGSWDEALVLQEQAADLNPRYFASVVELGITYVFLRQYDRAERQLERARLLDAEDPTMWVVKTSLCLLRDGDTAKARETLQEASKFVPKPAKLGFDMHTYALMRILPDTYAELLDEVPPERYGVEDTTLFHVGMAEVYEQLGEEETARGYWKDVRAHLGSAPTALFQYDANLCLGLAYAGLGRNEEAVRIAREAMAQDPLSEDALLGTYRLELAAVIFARTGRVEEAIDHLEVLLSVPSETSAALLRLDPAWDPLRDNPRFQKLVEDEP
jgi:tetratricopeptide (TPR) repeat protein